MKSKRLWTLLAVVLGVTVYVGNVLATPANGLVTTILAKATVPDLNLSGHAITTTTSPDGRTRPTGVWLAWIRTLGLSDVYVVDNKIPPGGDTGWHSHPGPSLVFVVAGTVTNYTSDDPTCAAHTYSAGSSFVDSGGSDVHIVRNEGTAPAETIAVQFIPAGGTRRIDSPTVPANCSP
jgi:quercetin dioxygenase-like cupin family protein